MNIYKAIKRDLMLVGIVGILFSLFINWITPYDTCDGDGQRCGLRIRTDALTGCQYLESSQGSLMPRLDRSGRPMCGVTP